MYNPGRLQEYRMGSKSVALGNFSGYPGTANKPRPIKSADFVFSEATEACLARRLQLRKKTETRKQESSRFERAC